MAIFSSWLYPLQGIVVLGRTPHLRQVVQRFLLGVTATSAAAASGWLYFFYNRHVKFLSQLFGNGRKGAGAFTKLAAALIVLAESSVPVYLLFDRRFEQLQGQLFDETARLRGVNITQMPAREQQALAAAVAARQQQREAAAAAAAAAWRNSSLTAKATRLLFGSVTNVTGLLTQLVARPDAHEGLVIRKARGILTAVVSGFVPPLLPLIALRDSGAAAARLMTKYWDRKGVPRNAGELA